MDIQSPINLTATVRATSLLPLRLNWNGDHGFTTIDEHGMKIVFIQPSGHTALLDHREFVLREFHFHHPSEHFVNGLQFDGELHIVHQNLIDCSYFVLAIFLACSDDVDECQVTSGLTKRSQDKQKCIVSTDPNAWIPKHVELAYRYEGSLTTPPYADTVSWVVLQEPLKVSKQTFENIFFPSKATSSPLSSHISDSRGLQPVNRRYIIEHKVKL